MKEIYDMLDRLFDEAGYNRLHDYVRYLHTESQKHNLIGWRSEHEIWRKGIYDSVYWTQLIQRVPQGRCVDIGAGAGFPGIPLKCFFPEIHLTLVESIGKKAQFLESVCRMIFPGEYEVCGVRAEELARDPRHRETYDWAFTRALAGIRTLNEVTLPLLKSGGRAAHLKGTDVYDDVRASLNGLATFGGRYDLFYSYTLPGSPEARNADQAGRTDNSEPREQKEPSEVLVLVTKVTSTPPQFPRKAGTPFKKPM